MLAQVEAGTRDIAPGAVLSQLLAESRQRPKEEVHCEALERERRLAAARAAACATMPRHLLRQKGLLLASPLHQERSAVHHIKARDSRSAVHCRRSALGLAFPDADEYEVALLLHAFAEPAPQSMRQSHTPEQLAEAGWCVLPAQTRKGGGEALP